MADSMWIRVPVAMKAKVTEDLKLKIIGDLQNTIKQMEADLNQFDFTGDEPGCQRSFRSSPSARAD